MGVNKKASQSTWLLSETPTMAGVDSYISKRTNFHDEKIERVGTRGTDALEY